VNTESLGPLFEAPYPETPGYAHDSETSRGAAQTVAPKASVLRLKVLFALLDGDFTPDEIADRVGEIRDNIKPRCTELRKPEFGVLVERTGERRPSAHGNPSSVLRLTDAGRRVASSCQIDASAGVAA
jgi:hypothetical protein